jgi:hypothetical protein
LWNCVVENLVEIKKEKKRTNCFVLFYNEECRAIYLSPNHGWNGHMGGGDSTCGNGNYE